MLRNVLILRLWLIVLRLLIVHFFILIWNAILVPNLILYRLFLLNLLRLGEVYVIDWSTVDINNLSIAYRDSHELVSIPDDRVSVEWVLFFLGLVQP